MKEFAVDLGIYGAKLEYRAVIAEKNKGIEVIESLPGCQNGCNVIFIASGFCNNLECPENDVKGRLYKGGLVKMGRCRKVKDDGYNNRHL